MQLPQLVHVVQDVYEAECEDGDHVKRQREQKEKEVAVVSPPDAVVHPRTVMVKVLGKEMRKKRYYVIKYTAWTKKKSPPGFD